MHIFSTISFMGSDKGIKYAGATIAQIMMQTDNNSMPKGLMRDYPEYEVRSTMLDWDAFTCLWITWKRLRNMQLSIS